MASSLLGVWQSVPYLFADQWRLLRGREAAETVDTGAAPYRLFLYALATVPAVGVLQGFAAMQRLYAVTGAAFMPILAATLLALGRPRWIGPEHRNRPVTNAVLVAILAFFTLLLRRALR